MTTNPQKPTMRKYLLSIPIGFLFLIYSSPSSAKSIWLECGGTEFNLDDSKREYSTTIGYSVFQGSAIFFPTQIDFSVPIYINEKGGGFRYDYSINRKTLEYQKKSMNRFITSLRDTGWVQQEGSSLTTGTCKIIKSPTKGNQI